MVILVEESLEESLVEESLVEESLGEESLVEESMFLRLADVEVLKRRPMATFFWSLTCLLTLSEVPNTSTKYLCS